ncbi:MAG: HNH endonuclease [Candidatus Dadabacteria bacterium]|nr:HNH endonuclease [Candidatus Dadabacteria bacterium]
MRPVEKGPAPRSYTDYRDAANDLVQRLGRYCNYCEKNLDNAPEVEHIQPKSSNPNLKLEWTNFLLACKNCNGIKSNKPVNLAQVAFPHTDNTFRGLLYKQGMVQVDPHLSTKEKGAIASLVKLVGLDRSPGSNKPTVADNRWELRQQYWRVAEENKRTIDKVDQSKQSASADELRESAACIALAGGHFSVWMTVFQDDPKMKRLLIKKFRGTAKDCFDTNGKPIPRPGGKL